MRALAALALTLACGSPKPVTHKPAPQPRPVDSSQPALPASPTPTPHKTRAAIEAPHGAAITAIAATSDGSAAITIDELGSSRLWPTLDGTQEPRVAELPAGRDLLLGKVDDGFTAVVLDEVGGLYIARLDREGRTLTHTTHGVDPPFAGIAMSDAGALGWRTDHRMFRFGPDGVIVEELVAEPQQRIIDIAAAGSRAIAIVDRAGKRALRWIDIKPRLAWGAWIEPVMEGSIGDVIALGPDHKHIAVSSVDDKNLRATVIEVAGAKQINARVLVRSTQNTVDLAFADATMVVVGSANGLAWVPHSAAVNEPKPAANHSIPHNQRHMFAAGGGRAIAASHGELALMTPTDTQFLGYDTLAPTLAHPGPNGSLVVSMGSSVHMLDAQLRSVASPQLFISPQPLAELQWLGSNDWLIESATGGQVKLELFDGTSGVHATVRNALPEMHLLAYEPSTQLVTLSFGAAAEVARFDAKNRALERVAGIAKPSPYEHVVFVPTAPKLARGTQLIQVTMRDKPTIKWIPDARALDKPSATLTLDGAYVGADPAGRVYAWRPRPSDSTLELVVIADGNVTATLPTQGPATLWPDTTGARIVEVSQGALILYDAATTKPVWSQELVGIHEAHWLSDGALAITHASGVARLDAKTGAVTAARCGWGFGLSPKPHPFAARIEPVCAQLPR